MTLSRVRSDQCPGVRRPWLATDGMLIRLRLIGGRLPWRSLQSLMNSAERFGDGRIRVTSRANLQLRGFSGERGQLTAEAHTALVTTGLVPSPTHELVRNIMVSPQSGLAGGRADLRPVAAALDSLLCADPTLADLPGKFLFVLDDGRGDLIHRSLDVGFVALGGGVGQIRMGRDWGGIIPMHSAATMLISLAKIFTTRRGAGPHAPWHVTELTNPLAPIMAPDPRVPAPLAALPYGVVPGGRHVPVPAEGLDRSALATVVVADESALDDQCDLVVTPWGGLLVPELTTAPAPVGTGVYGA
ncbi:MAG: nitrite reductase [Actinomycetota bacterium]